MTLRFGRRFSRLYPIGTPSLLRHEAHLARVQGGGPAASEHLQARAAACAASLGMKLEQRLALEGLDFPGQVRGPG